MSTFIELTEIISLPVSTGFAPTGIGPDAITYVENKKPILVNTDSIIKVDNNYIRLVDHSIRVEESFEQIKQLLV